MKYDHDSCLLQSASFQPQHAAPAPSPCSYQAPGPAGPQPQAPAPAPSHRSERIIIPTDTKVKTNAF